MAGESEELDKNSALSSSKPSSREMTTATTYGIVTAAVHGSTAQFLSFPGFSLAPGSKRRSVISGVRCALLPQRRLESRRPVSLSLVLLHFFSLSRDAFGASALDKYVKKKKLDPLEAYIPAVILTELQIKELGMTRKTALLFLKDWMFSPDLMNIIDVVGQYLEDDQPRFADCRSLLRSGPASSLRINIRAVAQYASDAGNGKYAFDEVDQCLRALEELDSLLLRASRKDSETGSIKTMKQNVSTALNALNSLLKTVPAEVLDKGKAMADAYLNPGEVESTQNLDPQLKQLESIL